MFRPLKPLKAYRETDPPVQCSTRIGRNPANPERYFRYLKRKFDARGFDIRLCGRAASIELNGTPLCTQHAGELVLSMLVCGELMMRDGASPLPPEAAVEYAYIGDVRVERRRASGIETEGHDRGTGHGAEHESPAAESGDAQP